MDANPQLTTSLPTPRIITSSKTITNYQIYNIGIILGESASIAVWFFDESGSNIGRKTFIMTGTDYANWSNNDVPYVANWVESQIATMTTMV